MRQRGLLKAERCTEKILKPRWKKRGAGRPCASTSRKKRLRETRSTKWRLR